MLKFISYAVCKKPSLPEAEDLVGMANGFYWLLDGATPPKVERGHEVTLAFVTMLDMLLQEYSGVAKGPQELLEAALSKMPDYGAVQPSATVVLVQVVEGKVRYLVLGDSFLSLCVDGKDCVVTDDSLKHVATEERQRVRDLREQEKP